jgi:hypothetical protein
MKKGEKMSTEPIKQEKQKPNVVVNNNGDAVYGIGLIGAWVYYFKRATTPQERVQAFFKGLVWPAFLVYELFVFLNKE